MKKIIAIVMAIVMVLTFASCGSSAGQEAISKKLDAISEQLDNVIDSIENGGTGVSGDVGDDDKVIIDEEPSGEAVTDASGEVVTDASGEVKTEAPKATKAPASSSNSNDPSKWTTQQIVDYYKKAASLAKGKSAQTMSIDEVPGILNLLKGLINNTLKERSEPFDGITGGYDKLQASDLKSASAKKSGNYIIINMVPKTQVDGAYGKSTEGTVGHLVSVLDGVATAVDALGVKAEYPEGSVKLEYKDGYAKNIKINAKTGVLESGSWGYKININLNGCKLSGITLKNVNAVITYSVVYPA